jgi:DNA-binding CsgD family transcriptional regulator
MTDVTRPDKTLARALSNCVLLNVLRTAGTADFPGALGSLVETIVSHDRMVISRYFRDDRPPEWIEARGYDPVKLARTIDRYRQNYYLADPFYIDWLENGRTGIIPLRKFNRQTAQNGLYLRGYLAEASVVDEIGLFFSELDNVALSIFVETAHRPFSKSDIDALQDTYPALSELHELHRRLSPARPLGGSEAELRHRRAGAHSDRTLPVEQWKQLTQREREIVEMILKGSSSKQIARELGISPGTVKNHRRNIYTKLHIETERELFLQHILFVSQEQPQI